MCGQKKTFVRNWSFDNSDIYRDLQFSKGKVSHKIIWGKLAAELNNGSDYASAKDKFKYLKRRYKVIKYESNKTGSSTEKLEEMKKDFPISMSLQRYFNVTLPSPLSSK